MEKFEKKAHSSSGDPRNELIALELDENGFIQNCRTKSEALFGYSREELFRHHISELLPQLASVELIKQGHINPLLDFLCHFGHFFRVLGRDGESFLGNLHLFSINKEESAAIRLLISPA